MIKTANGLVEYVKAQIGKPYWYGSFGQLGTQSFYNQKKRQYPSEYKWTYSSDTASKKVHDCVGLIKGYLWCDSPADNTPTYNGAQDVSANGMRDRCTKKGVISTIPEVAGTLVFMDGHMGVYIGNGEVIEARGHAYGVVKTKLSGRGWTSWGYCPWIEYPKEEEPKKDNNSADYTIGMDYLRKGDKGEAVKALQILLIGRGYSCGDRGADGDFGTATDTAVRAFQKENGLTVDGVVGKDTMSKLLGI